MLVGGGRGARRREARRQLRIDRAVLALLTDGSTAVVVEDRFDVLWTGAEGDTQLPVARGQNPDDGRPAAWNSTQKQGYVYRDPYWWHYD